MKGPGLAPRERRRRVCGACRRRGCRTDRCAATKYRQGDQRCQGRAPRQSPPRAGAPARRTARALRSAEDLEGAPSYRARSHPESSSRTIVSRTSDLVGPYRSCRHAPVRAWSASTGATEHRRRVTLRHYRPQRAVRGHHPWTSKCPAVPGRGRRLSRRRSTARCHRTPRQPR